MVRLLACVAVLSASTACGTEVPDDERGEEASADEQVWRYNRAITFVSWAGGEIAAAPFSFRTSPRGQRYEREVGAWLANGSTWDRFLEEAWSSQATGGVWRMVPHGELRMAVGGSGVEALWYDSGGRRLRLDVGDARSTWLGGERVRFRLLEGSMSVGSSRRSGVVVEELQVLRPTATGESGLVHDRMVLLDQEGFALYLLHEREAGAPAPDPAATSWAFVRGGEDAVQEGRVEWIEMLPVQEARRDIPLHWRFEAPELDLRGEVTALGQDASIGLERGGRRELEMRYTVEGWLERDGERVEVKGIVRHAQR